MCARTSSSPVAAKLVEIKGVVRVFEYFTKYLFTFVFDKKRCVSWRKWASKCVIE